MFAAYFEGRRARRYLDAFKAARVEPLARYGRIARDLVQLHAMPTGDVVVSAAFDMTAVRGLVFELKQTL